MKAHIHVTLADPGLHRAALFAFRVVGIQRLKFGLGRQLIEWRLNSSCFIKRSRDFANIGRQAIIDKRIFSAAIRSSYSVNPSRQSVFLLYLPIRN